MKALWQQPKGSECDECGCSVENKEAILIGENSHDFFEDTRQATICVDCIMKALQKIRNTFT